MAYEDTTIIPDKDGNAVFAMCLDISFSEPEWCFVTASSEEELRQEIVNGGYSLEHSTIIKYKLPDIGNIKKNTDAIKVLEVGITKAD